MIITKLKPEEMPTPPRCEKTVTWLTQMTRRGWTSPRMDPNNTKICRCLAKYEIDGQKMCRKHAAYHVLDELSE